MPCNALILMGSIWKPLVDLAAYYLNVDISVQQILFWWMLFQMLVVATSTLNQADTFFAISAFLTGSMMFLSIYHFIVNVITPIVMVVIADPIGNWPLAVVIGVFPALHLLVSIPRPQYFFL